jgi:hypothetical protein
MMRSHIGAIALLAANACMPTGAGSSQELGVGRMDQWAGYPCLSADSIAVTSEVVLSDIKEDTPTGDLSGLEFAFGSGATVRSPALARRCPLSASKEIGSA